MIETTYMDQYIADGQNESISLNNLYDTILLGQSDSDHIIRIPIDDFFLKYRDELSKYIEIYSVPQNMFYKPKLLSFTLYGTTELWLSLLRINNMTNITEFHSPAIKIYEPTALKELIKIFFKREEKI